MFIDQSRAFKELQYQAWESYVKRLQVSYTVTFDWEKRIPVGRSKAEHYAKAGRLLASIVKDNVQNPWSAVLLIPASILPILLLNSSFKPLVGVDVSGAYQIGELCGTPIVVDPVLSGKDYFMLIDVETGKVVRIEQGAYDYEADADNLKKELARSEEDGLSR